MNDNDLREIIENSIAGYEERKAELAAEKSMATQPVRATFPVLVSDDLRAALNEMHLQISQVVEAQREQMRTLARDIDHVVRQSRISFYTELRKSLQPVALQARLRGLI